MKVLITGASGFVGGFLVRELVSEGHEVIALVRKTSDLSSLRSMGCTLAYGNIHEPASLRGAFQGVSAVFHLAGLVAMSSENYDELERVNVRGTAAVVDLCIELGVKRLIHVSSVAAVGASQRADSVLDESSRNTNRGNGFPNYEAKARGEELVLEACKTRGLNAVVVNPSVIVGAGDARKPARKAQVQAARGELRFYPEGGLSVVAAEDVVRGIIEAWKKGRSGERYILSGENITLKEMLSIYSELAGARPPRHKLPNWFLRALAKVSSFFGDKWPVGKEPALTATQYHWYDHSKARKELGFQPRSAREAIQDSVDWMEEHGFLQKF